MGIRGAIFPRKCPGTCVSVGRVGSFVPKLYIRYTRINFSAAKKAFGSKVEVPPKYFISEISLVTSLFDKIHGRSTFRVI